MESTICLAGVNLNETDRPAHRSFWTWYPQRKGSWPARSTGIEGDVPNVNVRALAESPGVSPSLFNYQLGE